MSHWCFTFTFLSFPFESFNIFHSTESILGRVGTSRMYRNVIFARCIAYKHFHRSVLHPRMSLVGINNSHLLHIKHLNEYFEF